MAGRQDIKAGSAYVELLLRDSKFLKGLQSAGQRLKSFGTGAAAIGASIGAGGAAIQGALLVAVNQFAEVGSNLNDMSKRTGVAASALAELGHAANMTGSDLGTVENSLRKMQKLLNEAATGSKAANQSLTELGLTITELSKLPPDAQFQAIADKIALIPNPTRRAAKAMEIFGKTGTSMLPMIENLRELREEARALGIAPSEASIKAADDIGDAMDRVKASVGAVVYEIGFALSDSILEATSAITKIVKVVRDWVSENHQLVTMISTAAAGMVAFGAATLYAGLAVAIWGEALEGVGQWLGIAARGVGLLLTPWGLLAAAVTAGVVYWANYSTAGQEAIQAIRTGLASLAETAKSAFSGVADALSAGELALAGEIAMAGLQAVWFQGIAALNAKWEDFKAFVLSVANDASSGIASAFVDAWHGIKSVWIEAEFFFKDLFGNIAANARRDFLNITKFAHNAFLTVSEFLGPQNPEQIAAARELINSGLDAAIGMNDSDQAKRSRERQAARDAALSGLDADRQAAQDSIERSRLARRGEIGGSANADVTAANNRAAAARARLAELTGRAASAAEIARAEAAARAGMAGAPDMGAMRSNVVGSFSAAALQAAGGQGGPAETNALLRNQVANQKAANNFLRELHREAQRQSRWLEDMSAGAVIT